MSDPTDFMTSKVTVDVTDSRSHHDRVLIVGDTKFYVVSGILITWSEFFRGMFSGYFEETDKSEIELKKVDPEVFEAFLKVLYDKSLEYDGWSDTLLVPLIELAYRFLSPIVLENCKNYIETNFDKLDEHKVKLLEKSCEYENTDLKEKIINNLKKDSVMDKIDFEELVNITIEYKLDALKDYLGTYKSSKLTVANCTELLEFTGKYKMSKLKDGISVKTSNWKRQSIPQENIIDLLQSAFKHNLEPLKILLRQCIYHATKETTDIHKEITPELVKEEIICNNCSESVTCDCYANDVNIPITVNSFLEKYHDQIYALPSDIREFIITSTFCSN